MEWLLPKKDQERLSLHRYLNAQESNVVLIKGIMDSLGWSRYMVLQNVTMLRIDYQQIGDCNTSYLSIVDSNRALHIEQLRVLMSRLWTGFFGTERCRTPKIFQNPDFSLKRRDFWVFL